jgi:hypothetical protein
MAISRRTLGAASLLALLAACAGGEPDLRCEEASPGSADPELAQILEWIGQLGADEIEKRESATARLIQSGVRAAASLRGALRRDDPELRTRARYVLDRIRWDAFPGGQPQAGFKLALQRTNDQYKKGETIPLDLQIWNVQPVEQRLPRIVTLAWDTARCEGLHPGAQALLVLQQLSGLGQKKRIHFGSQGSNKPYVSPRVLARGKMLAYKFSFVWSNNGLQDHCDDQSTMEFPENLNPGDYEAYVVYFVRSKDLLKDANEDLKSNVIRFKVTD